MFLGSITYAERQRVHFQQLGNQNTLGAGFPGGSVVKCPTASAGEDKVLSLVLEDSTCLGAIQPACCGP